MVSGDPMRHVILGNGPAGVIAAEAIRKYAPADEIVLIGDEPEPPYSRMAIPYLLGGSINEQGTHLRKKADHFQRLRISLRVDRAARVDAAAGKVLLKKGGELAYDRLLIATGSHPARLPTPGADLPGVHNCWTLEDARRIMASAAPKARVLQIGAGFIGCIILEALVNRGVSLTVVEMGDRMVPRMMGQGAGGMIKRWVETKGVKVYTSTRVEAIERDASGALAVRLSNGERALADLVISATGVKPNIDFLAGSGIACGQGVLADAGLHTNVAGVYTAGDCAEAFDAVLGRHVVSAIQPNAADQAHCAALNMIGREASLQCVTQINVLDTLGLISSSFGNWEGVAGGDHVERQDDAEFRLIRLEFDGDRLVGANTIGLTEHLGVLRGLIQSRVPLGRWKRRLMEDPQALSEAYLASAQAQSAWGQKAA
jgi:NAD(P)H-nitrite reductase large subunit